MKMTGCIFNIQRFCIHDGPGIRTTVFLKGCPLNCVWCHNPESQKVASQLLYSPEHCVGCGDCVQHCQNHLHRIENGVHLFDRKSCVDCGDCAKYCFHNALEYCGRTASVDEIIKTVKSDLKFYQTSGGGMTLSGGEPLLQSDFSAALAHAAKEAGIHVCMETSGFCKTETLLNIMPQIDLFLFDFKLWDEELHKKYVGVSNQQILYNLHILGQQGADVILRCPIIPEINLCDAHFDAIAKTALENSAIRQIDLLPYHPLGISKNGRLGKEAPYGNTEFLEKAVLEPYAKRLQEQTGLPVKL